ncbi:hypothetical protein H9660_03545 [Clostridium sp. Sa3CUN1]|uniref:Phage major tail protein, phi13 family n=1 Tax=Clostridium gallinarum TaxID=2762246 RepID=A0ABR8Q1D1_9CLOT|nr:hypothetical protein [Clostridium gallinarum]MBD7914212.1 hypothetical protein [Clostridium gallinarum]
MARETGVKNLTAFKMDEGNTYGTAIPMKNCVSLKTTNSYKDISYESDCTIEHSSAKLDYADVEVVMSSAMGYKLLADLTGMQYKNGKASTIVETVFPQFALAYSIVLDDGTERRRVLYNCNLKKDEQSNETDSEGETWTLSGKALPVEIDGVLYVDTILDQKEIEAIEDLEEKTKYQKEFKEFFSKVVMPGEPIAA